MTSRELVSRTPKFENSGRVPRDLWALPYISFFRSQELKEVLDMYPTDIGRSEMFPGSDEKMLERLSKVGTYQDEWRSVWGIG